MSLTTGNFALADELLQQRQQVQQLLVCGIIEPALDRNTVIDLMNNIENS